jgi:hypothetical protein
MGYKNTQRGGTAMDAATSSSLAFLSSELEYASPKLIKPLTSMTHPRDVTVEYGGGFVEFISAYASDYATTGGNQYGLQGTNNTDIPQIQAVVNKGIWQAWNWAVGFTITHIDLERLRTAKRFGQIAPFSLQKLLEGVCHLSRLDEPTRAYQQRDCCQLTGTRNGHWWSANMGKQGACADSCRCKFPSVAASDCICLFA